LIFESIIAIVAFIADVAVQLERKRK
jgi:hypothetical protein